jgi:glycosyltransferase involved in cell wall biosynthesis
VVITTYNRAEVVVGTLKAVLDQQGVDFDVVVVDDGSTDATPERLAGIDDPRLRVVHQPNAGMASARNTGLATAEGAWAVFLDDDDVPAPGWLAALAGPAADPGVGITCCGARAVDPDGREICLLPVVPLGPPFGDVVGAFRAGTFAVRTDLFRRAGGYLDGLGASEQFELFIRLLDEARRAGLRVASTDGNLLDIERRPVDDRRSSNPWVAYDATTWVLSRHGEMSADQPVFLARFESVAGAAAARSEHWGVARRHFWRSARLDPGMQRWGRLVLCFIPPLARRVWTRHGRNTYDPTQLGVRSQLTPADTRGEPELFLAWRYRQNPPTHGPDAAPDVDPAVRRLARRLARGQPSLVLGLGTLERHDDPVGLLQQLAREAADTSGAVLLSTADRTRSDPDRPLGPPSNPDHRREWSADQLALLLRSTGIEVGRTWKRGTNLVVLGHPSWVLSSAARPLEVARPRTVAWQPGGRRVGRDGDGAR